MAKSTKKKRPDCPRCGKHCYARLLNKQGEKVYDEDKFCQKCGAHLAASGICLNACHLSAASRARFNALFSGSKP